MQFLQTPLHVAVCGNIISIIHRQTTRTANIPPATPQHEINLWQQGPRKDDKVFVRCLQMSLVLSSPTTAIMVIINIHTCLFL